MEWGISDVCMGVCRGGGGCVCVVEIGCFEILDARNAWDQMYGVLLH